MPASVYKLVYNDPELKKLANCDLETGIYTTDTVKIVGSCPFYLVHLDTKKLQEVMFYVAKMMVSTQSTNQVVTVPDVKHLVSKLVTSREQILHR